MLMEDFLILYLCHIFYKHETLPKINCNAYGRK